MIFFWERKRDWFVVPLIFAFIRWFLYVPWTGIESTTLTYQDDALPNWAAQPGLTSCFKLSPSCPREEPGRDAAPDHFSEAPPWLKVQWKHQTLNSPFERGRGVRSGGKEGEERKFTNIPGPCHLDTFLKIQGLICTRISPPELEDTSLPLAFHTTKKEAQCPVDPLNSEGNTLHIED